MTTTNEVLAQQATKNFGYVHAVNTCNGGGTGDRVLRRSLING